ncbi:LysR family transcriptional regulator [uncultured Microbulbifer sp.]|uniref:LysR family transcriptional regulator n=1 Tax=uncultured Microbulbifer sp. TaxID=348147 RepID=UPI0026135A88|nr:LysR family transcriptional regulator [uncultured Microbulbifer sp.]
MLKDVRYLIVFAKVVEGGSFRSAAHALDMSISSASQYVSKLEESLGVALLYRNTRKLSLTQDGKAIFGVAKKILELYSDNLRDYRNVSRRGGSKLRVAIPAILINSRLVSEISSFASREPDLHLHLLCSDLHNDLIGEGIDLAIRLGDMPDSGLKARKIFMLDRVLVASTDFVRRHGLFEHPRDLQDAPWIGLTMRPSSRTFIHRDHGHFKICYNPVAIVDNVEASYRMAMCGLGLAAPPRFLFNSSDGVEEILPEWQLPPLPAYAVWPPNISVDSPVQRLISYINSQYT